MIFESVYIKSFGTLVGRTFDFQSGVNILEGANESGKSTICGFIKFMFYGLPAKTEDKLHDISWKTASAGGTLTFREGDKRYRIEREVVCSTNADGKYSFRERLAIFDAVTNRPCFKGQSPGEVFFGVSANVFENTAYIRQTSTPKIGGQALGAEAENILFSGNESINTKKAVERLESARVFLLHKNRRGGKITELEARSDELAEQLEIAKKASGDIIYLEGSHRQLSEKKAESERRLVKLNAELDAFNRYTVKKACARSKAEKQRLDEMEEKIESIRIAATRGGQDIASDDYIGLLEKKQGELELATSRYGDAEQALQNANKKLAEMSEKLAVFERFGAKGGKTREELVAKTRAASAAMETGKKSMVVCVIGAVICLVMALVMMFGAPDIPAVLSYMLLTMAPILAFVVLFLSSKNKNLYRSIMKICAKFGCKDVSEFEELVRAATEDEAYMVFITGARDEATDKFNAASGKLEKVSAEILQNLRAHGFSIRDNTAASLSEALHACRAQRAERMKLKSAAEELRSRVDALTEDLSAYSEDYLKEALYAEYDEAAMESFNLPARNRDRDFLNGSIRSLTEKLHAIDIELASLRTGTYEPTELAEEKAAVDGQIAVLTKKWAAYMLAIESIEKASGKLREGISPKIAKNASRLMYAITEGKYADLGVDAEFELSFSADGMTHHASYLSAGTSDLAYICLRIALIELLYKKSMPPFLFDESFVRMDDERLARTMFLLHKYGQRNIQSILLSCHTRERKISDAIGSYGYLSI